MMKTMFSRVGRSAQSGTVVRHLSSKGSTVPSASKSGSRLLLQSQKQVQLGSSSGLAKSLGAIRGAHDQRTKGDEELLGFLEEEIATEKKMQRSTSIPSTFQGFSVSFDRSEIILTKKVGNEEVIISANVNHSVDAEFGEDPNVKQPPKEPGTDEMRSKPNFDVEIKKGNQILCFNCSFLQNAGDGESQEEFSDIFAIDEVCIYEGDWKDTDYAVAGDILDGYLYDLFMNLLEERGITNELVEKFSDLCTDYEHSLYVDLLVKMQKFIGNK
ncbi:Complement component 1 Q subcomponent-binding protein, mitochondrial [Orchesella cincta]|uniref:Complement component 1 Q subcomponent-binding protein, mitochondrial n=1 Tax=Orchesella cincta TaxID=48709 RepID=A0A1D2NI27_ORCCI|nr:Complement component 1 Q subcomponent-binding protein, mitochondrial [Orchesella cincta]